MRTILFPLKYLRKPAAGYTTNDVPTTINDFVTGAVLLAIVTLTNRGKIGSVIK